GGGSLCGGGLLAARLWSGALFSSGFFGFGRRLVRRLVRRSALRRGGRAGRRGGGSFSGGGRGGGCYAAVAFGRFTIVFHSSSSPSPVCAETSGTGISNNALNFRPS